MAWRVDQVEDMGNTTLWRVGQPDGVRLDSYSTLTLKIHRVEHLGLHLTRPERSSELKKSVGECRLSVIDVRDDRKISDIALVHERTVIIVRRLNQTPTCATEPIEAPHPDADGARTIGQPMERKSVDTQDRRSLPAV